MSSPSTPPVVELLYAGNAAAVAGVTSAEAKRGWKGLGAEEGERVRLGEGSLWDHRTGRLYWIDILGAKLHCMEGETSDRHWRLPSLPGTVALTQRPMVVLVACADGLYTVNTEDGQVKATGIVPDKGLANHRCNDGKIDPQGRLVVGTMNMDEGEEGKGKGSVYRVDASGRLERLLSTVSIPNGLAWSRDGLTFFHTDTPAGLIRRFPYQGGDVGAKRWEDGEVAVRIPEGWGGPDGCAVDEDDNLWVASCQPRTALISTSHESSGYHYHLPLPLT